ncbi:acyl carrier protein [Roseibium marinum]|uniref:Acyl carrier protein n=1 Tax=Roseibium marinum TaxID=281252 RepID=A0A2S3UP06_9HYPH|nr:acyl carrier protein [Roseibium marinum]POF29445.1 acyl carrier protein [Roseibium marinum]
MSQVDIDQVVREELGNIAPDMDLDDIDPQGDLREELDIDSMDFLNFVTALHQRLGVAAPELDYPKLMTMDGAIAYLKEKRA